MFSPKAEKRMSGPNGPIWTFVYEFGFILSSLLAGAVILYLLYLSIDRFL